MSPEKQRITIAEACGWVKFKPRAWRQDLICWSPPKDVSPIFLRMGKNLGYGDIISEKTEFCENDLPDYLNDLNAMNSAEKTLTVKQQHKFAEEVGRIIYSGELSVPDFRDNWYMCYLMMHASAARRAEAFIKTIGKWEN